METKDRTVKIKESTMRIKDISYWDVGEFDTEQLEQTRRAPGTLVVHENTPAIDVATATDAIGSRVVILVDDNDQPTGVFVPPEVTQKLRDLLGIAGGDLADALREMEPRPEEREREYHHEWLNYVRPRLFWCSIGNHHTDVLPCPECQVP